MILILKWTDYIVQLLLNENIISENDRAVYQYCVQTTLFQLLTYSCILLLAVYFDVLGITLAYYAGFLPVRYVAGGYHAGSHRRCFCMTVAIYVISLGLCFQIIERTAYAFLFGSVVISIVMILWAAPVDHKNRTFSPREKERFKKQSYGITMIIIVLALLLMKISDSLSVAMILGTLSAACSLFAGKIQRRREQLC